MTEKGNDAFEFSGLSIGSVYAIYSQIESTFKGTEGRMAVINAIIKANIILSHRPGWLGLQSPGNIYALSVVFE